MATESDRSGLAGLEFAELEAELATLAAHLCAGTCRWLELVAEVDRRGGSAVSVQGSCAAWLAWRCGLTPRGARGHVRVARCLRELPATHAAFACGELSYAKARALTRIATAGDEQRLLALALARELTAAQLERAVRAYRRVTTAEAREQQERAFLSVSWDEDGCLELHGRLAPEDGALLLRALEAQRDRVWKDGGSAEPRPGRQVSTAEALVAVCDTALAHSAEGRTGGERYQVIVHADEATLTRQGGQTQLDNLLLLCRHHHRAVHEGRYTLEHQGRFYYPWANSSHAGMGDPMDLGLTVDAMLQAAA